MTRGGVAIASCLALLLVSTSCKDHKTAALASPSPSESSSPTPVESGAPSMTTAPVSTGPTPRCAGAHLKLRFERYQSAGGDYVGVFQLVNTSAAPCHLQGFPGVTLRGPSAADQVAVRNSKDRVGYIPTPYKPRLVVVAPGSYAEFVIEGAVSNSEHGTDWPKSSTALVYAPDDTVALTVGAVMPMPQTPYSTITVSVVEPPGCIEPFTCE